MQKPISTHLAGQKNQQDEQADPTPVLLKRAKKIALNPKEETGKRLRLARAVVMQTGLPRFQALVEKLRKDLEQPLVK